MKPSPDEIKVRPLSERDNLVKHDDFAQVLPPVEGFGDWFRSLPDIYGGTNLKRVVELVVAARKSDKQVGISLGAHLLKCGLSPLLIDLMRRGFVTHVSTNGAGVIHDWEIAYQGETSEDVAARAEREQIGYGAALGQTILDEGLPHASLSVWGEARRLGIPATVHVAFGCDIVHMDPALDGAALGNATQRDFWLLADTVGKLDGGIWLNIGSAVIMPEVFLKAVSIARNRGALGTDFATCNFDMMHQYRALTNVVQRPPREGLSVICQHEIILPILHQALLALGSEAGLDMEVR
jgi:hypothetical protein